MEISFTIPNPKVIIDFLNAYPIIYPIWIAVSLWFLCIIPSFSREVKLGLKGWQILLIAPFAPFIIAGLIVYGVFCFLTTTFGDQNK